MADKRITAFEIVDHGVDHAQYFQGVGTAFTEFEDVALGSGDNAKEAYEGAVEGLASMGYDVSRLPTRPRGIRKSDKVRHAGCPAEDDACELHYYVSIKVR